MHSHLVDSQAVHAEAFVQCVCGHLRRVVFFENGEPENRVQGLCCGALLEIVEKPRLVVRLSR